MPRPTLPRRSAPSLVSTGVVTGLAVALFAATVAAAAPAAAIDDPTRPDARVTHGPSCRPGGLVIEVQAGDTAYFVRLATTRQPGGEAEKELAPGESVTLRSGDVAWGETIDGRLEYAARDGSGLAYVDELEDYSFTRPTQEDCAAVTAPASPEPSVSAPGSAPAPVPTPAPATDGGDAAPAPPVPGRPSGSGTAPTADGGRPSPASPVPGAATSGAAASRVAAGSTVVVQATGYEPGERVTILMHAGGAVLGSVVAGHDGSVRAEVVIPSGTATGATRLDLVGDSSAVVTNLELQVAADQRSAPTRGTVSLWALVAAAVALVGSVGGLVSVAGRQRAARQRILASGGA
jgi:hypothetical protein